MSENLKPCPICGGMAVVQSPYKQAVHMEFYVRCMRCGLQTEVSTIEEIPVAEWNNLRAALDDYQATMLVGEDASNAAEE